MIRKAIKKGKEILKEEKGDGYILTCVIVIFVMMVGVVLFQVVRVNMIGNGIKDALENSVRRTVTTNWDSVFPGGRQGYTGAYTLNSDRFEELVNKNDILGELKSLLDLTYHGSDYRKINNNGAVEYQVSGLSLDVKNSGFATDSDNRFHVYATIQAKVSMGFMGKSYPVEFPIKIRTSFSPLF